MKIKKGDTVKVITGSYKGTIGEVIAVYPKTDKVVVEGVNMIKKALKPSQANPDGGIIEKEAPIHVSNVAILDPKTKKPTRIGHSVNKDGKKIRVAKKSNSSLD